MKIKQRGFTLVEVLIVVIIIAILAALILPRMTSQSGRAEIAEAQQMLGAIRRAQHTYYDTVSATYLDVNDGAHSANWAKLGMRVPSGGKYTYACTSGACTAVNKGGAGTIGLSLTTAGGFNCTSGYSNVSDSDSTKGCTK